MGMSETSFSTDHQPATSTRKRLSVDQEIALLEKKLALKRESQRKAETNQKIIVGGMMLALAEHDLVARKRLVELIEKHVKRPADVKRIEPLVAAMKEQTAETVHA
jgi:hypothetical protein